MTHALRPLNPCRRNLYIAAIVVLSVVLLAYGLKFDGNITGFFRIGSVLPLSPYLNPETTTIIPNELGYDGQQFLTIALDPGLQNPASIAALDNPPLRYRRIFYPLLSYFLGLGQSAIIPYMMVGINSLSILLLVWWVSHYLERQKMPTWPALGILTIPGLWISLIFSTADLLNTTLIGGVMYFHHQKRPLWATLCLTLATLTRETSLLIGLALIITHIWQRNQQYLRYSIPALLPMLVWNGFVFNRFSSTTIPGIQESFTLPFLGIVQKVMMLFSSGLNAKSVYDIYCFTLLILIVILGIGFSVLEIKNNQLVLIGLLFYSLVLISSSTHILDYFFNYPRTFIDLYVLFFWIVGRSRVRMVQGMMMGGLSASSLFFLLGHS